MEAEGIASVVRDGANPDVALVRWIESVIPDVPGPALDLARDIEKNPGRISRAYKELLSGYSSDPKDILTVTLELPREDHSGLIASVRTPFASLCPHHFLPFFGDLSIVYEPGPYIVGLGKLPRLVACRARRFQLQELLVRDICEDMMEVAKAKGAYVEATATHTCVCYRGPSSELTRNKATYSLGTLAQLSERAAAERLVGGV